MNEHARRELEPPATTLSRGSRGPDVRRLQEWLCLHGFHTAVDGDFGPATEAAVRRFQREHMGPEATTGAVDGETWATLVAPLARAVRAVRAGEEFAWTGVWMGGVGSRIVAIAEYLLAQEIREVGGPNAGPWVRWLMKGKEGKAYPWCAGFATTVLRQALGHSQWDTFSCDELAAKAHARGLLVHELPKAWRGPEHIKPGDLFLLRRTDRWPHDWTHCGIVTAVHAEHFETIEGNTNTDGSREGTAVHARARAFNERTDVVLIGGDR